jgi:hypothetical protein
VERESCVPCPHSAVAWCRGGLLGQPFHAAPHLVCLSPGDLHGSSDCGEERQGAGCRKLAGERVRIKADGAPLNRSGRPSWCWGPSPTGKCTSSLYGLPKPSGRHPRQGPREVLRIAFLGNVGIAMLPQTKAVVVLS